MTHQGHISVIWCVNDKHDTPRAYISFVTYIMCQSQASHTKGTGEGDDKEHLVRDGKKPKQTVEHVFVEEDQNHDETHNAREHPPNDEPDRVLRMHTCKMWF